MLPYGVNVITTRPQEVNSLKFVTIHLADFASRWEPKLHQQDIKLFYPNFATWVQQYYKTLPIWYLGYWPGGSVACQTILLKIFDTLLYNLAGVLDAVFHYSDIIMSAMPSQITSVTIVCWTVYSGADQRKRQSSASLTFVRGIHWWPVNSSHKGPVMRKMFPFDDVIISAKQGDT